MKSFIVLSLAFVASVFASAVPEFANAPLVPQKRQLESQASIIEALYQDVVAQTTVINATMAGTPDDPSSEDIDAAAELINPRLEAITEAIVAATSYFSEETKRALLKRQDDDDDDDEESCDAECFTERVLEVVYEIVSTIRAIILTFGLGPFLSQINPLLLALSALVTSLNVLVTGLLLTVTLVVTTLLGGLGLSLLLLGWG